MSPEQAMGDSEPDRRSDIYSLGCVAYFLVTGRPPFVGSKPLRVIMAHTQDEVDLPSDHVDTIPEDFERIVLRCLAKRPEDRFQSADELAEALDGCSDAGGWTRRDAERWWTERREEALADATMVTAS
jgi:serine/threonine-protein kinase